MLLKSNPGPQEQQADARSIKPLGEISLILISLAPLSVHFWGNFHVALD